MTINRRAILSGALGATASFIAKLALAPDSPLPSAVHAICIANATHWDDDGDSSRFCPSVSLLARGVCFLCMIGVNAFMISTFLDGMNESGSVVGTALSTAANFSCSVSVVLDGIAMRSTLKSHHNPNLHETSSCINEKQAMYGVLFFGEYVPISWYFGATLIASGMWLLSSVTLEKTAS